MRLALTAVATLFLPAIASAQTMVATRPGLMCIQPGALATLTLPDGSNRGASPSARPDDEATKRAGGCIDIPPRAVVSVHQRRINTSIVSYDAGDGRGDRTWIVPNIDFSVGHDTAVVIPARPEAPSPAPADSISSFFSALNQHCPNRGWEHADMKAYGPPLEEAAKSLSTSQHQSLTQDVSENCPATDTLECGNTVAIRHVVQAGHLSALTQAFCSAAPETADSVKY